MQELISKLAGEIGIDERTAEKATGMILSLLQRNGDPGAVASLMEKLPGAADLAGNFTKPAAASGGLFSMIGGGSTGDALATVGALQADGLSTDQIKEIGGGILS